MVILKLEYKTLYVLSKQKSSYDHKHTSLYFISKSNTTA